MVISGLETLDYPAVLVGQAMTNYEETEWTKKNVMQVNSVTRQDKKTRGGGDDDDDAVGILVLVSSNPHFGSFLLVVEAF